MRWALYTKRTLKELTEQERAISLKLTPVCRNYHAGTAQKDLDRLTEKGLYILDGDTYRGYLVRHKDGSVICRNFSPRDSVILTVSLWESSSSEVN